MVRNWSKDIRWSNLSSKCQSLGSRAPPYAFMELQSTLHGLRDAWQPTGQATETHGIQATKAWQRNIKLGWLLKRMPIASRDDTEKQMPQQLNSNIFIYTVLQKSTKLTFHDFSILFCHINLDHLAVNGIDLIVWPAPILSNPLAGDWPIRRSNGTTNAYSQCCSHQPKPLDCHKSVAYGAVKLRRSCQVSSPPNAKLSPESCAPLMPMLISKAPASSPHRCRGCRKVL